MAIKTKEKEELTISQGDILAEAQRIVEQATVRTAVPTASVRAAAIQAAEEYDVTEMEEHAHVIANAWEAKLNEYSKTLQKRALAQQRDDVAEEIAGPITPVGYQWWNLLLAGPYQAITNPPFLPHKIIQNTQNAFMLVALWRNPVDVVPGLSACNLMTGWTFTVNLETINLTSVSNGPDLPAGGLTAAFPGGSCTNVFVVPMPAGTFNPVVQGKPNLFEINATVDIVAPNPTAPFAGYSTWLYDPDFEPPFLGRPGVMPGFQYDTPARFLVYA